jgi:hypothetical protein
MAHAEVTPRRSAQGVALALAGGAAGLGVLAVIFGNESAYLRSLLVAGSPVPAEAILFDTAGGVAVVVLVAGLLLAAWLLHAPLRSRLAPRSGSSASPGRSCRPMGPAQAQCRSVWSVSSSGRSQASI